ncbi:MAG TPA: hypothetical protein PLM60_06650 [Methanoregulaceae archaeon]|jgi:hypothetical protein|nr:hypothetical protein [Methanoregulaceae archaeon]HPA07146.1 hypothetical protein [Methanoregulaceae archaeon]HPS23067.1 hypothetical protein [Methanoregulaceae archaeon]HQN89335.1 hypothetical protein [Methanoregulaceae archaeon]HQP81837.1 hypothetical protein [Methanoregulaceae archaeon]
MVTDDGQLYTIEGIAAALMIVVTAYLVVSTTTVLTQQDVHIIDLQLQQLGNDALAMMDTPDYWDEVNYESNLSSLIKGNKTNEFHNQFLAYLNAESGSGMVTGNYEYNATIYYQNSTEINSYVFYESQEYYRENAVKVSRWVSLKDSDHRTVLLEVQLWRE